MIPEPPTHGFSVRCSCRNSLQTKGLCTFFSPKKWFASRSHINQKLLTTQYPLLTDELFDELLNAKGHKKEMVV